MRSALKRMVREKDFESLPISTKLNDERWAFLAQRTASGVEVRARMFRHYTIGERREPHRLLGRTTDRETDRRLGETPGHYKARYIGKPGWKRPTRRSARCHGFEEGAPAPAASVRRLTAGARPATRCAVSTSRAALVEEMFGDRAARGGDTLDTASVAR